MIQLRSDCLVFETAKGEAIPCSVEQVTVEVIGEAVARLDKELIGHAAAAVLHYFREELGRTYVTLGEFAEALERVLRGFGLAVSATSKPKSKPRVAEADLRQLAFDSGKGCELVFFPRLRAELRDRLRTSPQLLRFTGLRGCVKQLVGARRWCGRCQKLSDQIVDYLRHCLSAQAEADRCALLVS